MVDGGGPTAQPTNGPMGDEEGTTAHGGNRGMWPADTELGLWADGGPADVAGLVDGRQPEETGGCGRRTLGRMTGGGPADVAGFHHHTSSIGSYFCHRWVDENGEGQRMSGWL